MKSNKRIDKENSILDAAERVFADVGFRNARMEDVAKVMGMSKGSIYFYFESKENLLMAVTFRAYSKLIESYKTVIRERGEESGRETVLRILKAYLDYCDSYPGYFELLMNFMAIIRSGGKLYSKNGLTDALVSSPYFQKLREVENEPFRMALEEIERGQKDGSIGAAHSPAKLYLIAWAMVVGYTEIMSLNSPGDRTSILQVQVEDWKRITFDLLVKVMENPDLLS